MFYKKRPVVIEAYRFTGKADEPGWPKGWLSIPHNFSQDGEQIFIPTLEGVHAGNKGDFIIKGIKEEFYPCKPDIFNATYDEAELACVCCNRPRRVGAATCEEHANKEADAQAELIRAQQFR